MTDRTERFAPHNKMNDKVWNTAAYARLSDEDRDKLSREDLSKSLENQICFIRDSAAYVNRAGESRYPIQIYKVYTDDDFTGMDFKRKAFQEMMRDVKNNVIDCIMVKNLSRFGRYDTEMQQYLEKEFEQSGRQVRLIAIGDNYDSLYREIGLDIKMLLMINREYSEIQHKNVSIAMHSMQKAGKYVGAFAPYGYQKDPENKHHLVLDLYSAGIVRRIFRLYLSGISMKEIALILTREGVVNRAAYKKLQQSNYICSRKISEKEMHWTVDAVKQILMNEVYTGTLVQGKTRKERLIDEKPTAVDRKDWIRVENTHEAIISKEDWKLAQSMMKNICHDTTKPNEISIFKGLLKCGDCSHAMRKRWDKHTTKTGETHRYLYYNCSTFRDFAKAAKGLPDEEKARLPICTSHYISDKVLQKMILEDINRLFPDGKTLTQLIAKQRSEIKEDSSRVILEKDISNRKKAVEILQNRMRTARDKYLDGLFSDEEYRDIKAEYQESISRYENEILDLQKSAEQPDGTEKNLWVENLLKYGKITELDRETVIRLVDKIYVYQDKHVEIVYKFAGL